jgi:ABC-type antimicrobial peptide transport system permease subunit
VEDGKYVSPTESQRIAVFLPESQAYNSTTMLLVRSSLSDSEMLDKIRETIAQLDPELPLFSLGALGDLLGFAFLPARAAAIALSAFGLLSMMLAVTGIHGLVSYSVARRTHEIGIRIAVGATPRDIKSLVLGRIFALLATGSG